MSNPNPENQNTLKSWATGRVAMSLIGLAVGIFLYKSGIAQKVIGKLFTKKEKSEG